MKAIHKNLGEVEVLGPDIAGHTSILKDGQIIEASTLYLTPIVETDDVTRPDTGTAGGG